MLLRRIGFSLFILLPFTAYAHNFMMGKTITPITVSDKGERVLSHDQISYKTWMSLQLAGKVRVVQFIVGRRSAKYKNSVFIKAR